ncbi:MAG: hypothetical protein JW838_06575 [Spirochaetes bacterium]|nr:hypothetical protein [Spirochaetota bacterium]
MNKVSRTLAALVFMALVPASAMAIGIGFYGEFNRGYETYGGNLGGDMKGSNDYTGGNGGIIIDTSAAKDRILNYRFRLGGGKTTLGKDTYTDIGMVHTFGVSPARLRGDSVRFWFGPRIGLRYLFAKMTSKPDMDSFYVLAIADPFLTPMILAMMSGGSGARLDIARLDLGLVFAGFNFNFGDYVTLSVELGFDYGFRLGKIKYGEVPGDAFGEGVEGFGVVSVMFRIRDTYSAGKEPEKINIRIE